MEIADHRLLAGLCAAALLSASCANGSTVSVTAQLDEPPSNEAAPLPTTSEAGDADGGPADPGPLALLVPSDVALEARSEGALRITDHCVYLEHMLLAWPADQVTWVEESQAVIFEDFRGDSAVLTDGVLIEVGGSTIQWGGDSESCEPGSSVNPEAWCSTSS